MLILTVNEASNIRTLGKLFPILIPTISMMSRANSSRNDKLALIDPTEYWLTGLAERKQNLEARIDMSSFAPEMPATSARFGVTIMAFWGGASAPVTAESVSTTTLPLTCKITRKVNIGRLKYVSKWVTKKVSLDVIYILASCRRNLAAM